VTQGCAAQVVHGLRQVENAGDHGIQVGVAGANVSEDALNFLLAAALLFLCEVAGQTNRNPGFNSDSGIRRGVLAELQGGHAKSGGGGAGGGGSSCIVLLPSGSGFSWFVFVGEGFGCLSTCFGVPERGIRRFLRFLEVF